MFTAAVCSVQRATEHILILRIDEIHIALRNQKYYQRLRKKNGSWGSEDTMNTHRAGYFRGAGPCVVLLMRRLFNAISCRFFVGTWNVLAREPPDDLAEWFTHETNTGGDEPCDVYALGCVCM